MINIDSKVNIRRCIKTKDNFEFAVQNSFYEMSLLIGMDSSSSHIIENIVNPVIQEGWSTFAFLKVACAWK